MEIINIVTSAKVCRKLISIYAYVIFKNDLQKSSFPPYCKGYRYQFQILI